MPINEREYIRLKNQLETEYRQKLDALNTVFKMTGGNPTAAARSADSGKKLGKPKRGALTDAITQVLPLFGGRQFTPAEVSTELKNKFPEMEIKDTSVSSALTRMAEENNQIAQTLTGKGRRASRYQNKVALIGG